MPTVDDLVISLTVKDTSNLGQLKKTLDNLMKPTRGGFTLPAQGVDIPEIEEILDTVDYIRKSVDFLIPSTTYSYREAAKFRKEGTRMAIKVAEMEEDIKDYFVTSSEDNFDKMREMFELGEDATVDDVKGQFSWVMKEIKSKIESVRGGIWRDKRAENFINIIKAVLADLNSDQTESMTLLRKLYAFMSEPQREMEKILEAVGVLKGIKTGMFSLKDNFFELYKEIADKFDKVDEDINSFIGSGSRFNKYFTKDKTSMESLIELAKFIRGSLGLGEESNVREVLRKAGEYTRSEIVKSMLKAKQEGIDVAMPTELWEQMKKDLKLAGTGVSILRNLMMDDVSLIADNISFLNLLSAKSREKMEQQISEHGNMVSLELKSHLKGTSGEYDKLQREQKIWGSNLIVAAKSYSDQAKQMLKELGITYIHILPEKMKDLAGIYTKITDMKDLLKSLETPKYPVRGVYHGGVLDNVFTEFTEEEIKEKLKTVKEDLGQTIKELNESQETFEAIALGFEEGDITTEVNRLKNQKKMLQFQMEELMKVSKTIEDETKWSYDEFKNIIKEFEPIKKLEEEGISEKRKEIVMEKIYQDLKNVGYSMKELSNIVRVSIARMKAKGTITTQEEEGGGNL